MDGCGFIRCMASVHSYTIFSSDADEYAEKFPIRYSRGWCCGHLPSTHDKYPHHTVCETLHSRMGWTYRTFVGLLGISFGVYLTWGRPVQGPGIPTLSFGVFITVVGVIQMISQVMGYRPIKKYQKVK